MNASVHAFADVSIPTQHLLVQGHQWKNQINVRNLLKVNRKSTRTKISTEVKVSKRA